MGRKSAKGKEKKIKKKEENTKLAAKLAIVEAANAQEDPMLTLQPFKKYDRNGLNISISCHRAQQLDESILDWAFELTKSNMQALYEMSEWGWNEKDKRDEMTDDRAWYLIAKDNSDDSGRPVALVHFRFDIDNGDEVLYCYEIQLCPEVRRKGLGKFMMQILELMAFKVQMKKVMVTIFKNNTDSLEFFVNKLKYGVDETSPEDTLEDAIFYPAEPSTYQILSKPIGVRQQQTASANGAAVARAAMNGAYAAAQRVMVPSCCDHCEHHH
jgi:GNAT superfamily N-acetyltransferase